MQATGALVCLALLLPKVGSVAIRSYSGGASSDPELTAVYTEAMKLIAGGSYRAAAGVFENGYRIALRKGSMCRAARFLNNFANTWYELQIYRKALPAYRESMRLAEACGDWESVASFAINTAGVYVRMGAADSAEETLETALRMVRLDSGSRNRGALLIQKAAVAAGRGRMDDALPAFREGISAASLEGNTRLEASGWNMLGFALWQHHRLEEAEAALSEAFRIWSWTAPRETPWWIYRNLGVLRHRQGNLRAARRLLDAALTASRRTPGPVPEWSIFYRRGLVNLELGQVAAAWDDLQESLDLTRRWRMEVAPADSFRTQADIGIHQIYAAFIESGNRLYALRPDPELLQKTFEAAEEIRAASLRETLQEADYVRARLPEQYWERLAGLRAAETDALRHGPSEPRRTRIRTLRHELTEMESRAGLEAQHGEAGERSAISHARLSMDDSEALLSFHLGTPFSYLWVVTARDFDVYKLAPRARLESLAERFRNAVEWGAPDVAPLGRRLHDELFGPASRMIADKPGWLLSLDGGLFRVPFAALETGGGILAQRHWIQIIPGAQMLSPESSDTWSGPPLAVGDPIYNTVDARWTAAGRRSDREDPLQMNRLAGSAVEAESCAGVWRRQGQKPVVLLGGAASREAVLREMHREKPSIAHFATHVIQAQEKPFLTMIALSLRADGTADLLSASEISNQRLRPGLVAMSGCESGAGESLPGAGLMGLPRAWMRAGAGAILASLWPTPDDSGEFFQAFYRYYGKVPHSRRHAAKALQSAQREIATSATWRSDPKYWAAYFVVGKD